MITAVRKPFDEIYELIKPYRKVLVLGCGSCVTVCMAGGEKEVGVLASSLRLAGRTRGVEIDVVENTIERQCDREFFDPIRAQAGGVDAVLSMACGVGVQFMSGLFEKTVVLPALNTRFYGATLEQGVWGEMCAGCGDCVLGRFAGVCPVARCSKSLMNGPCGGSRAGKCEVDPDTIPCGWQLIFDRFKGLGLLSRLEANEPIRDWRSGRDGGPGRIVRDDMRL